MQKPISPHLWFVNNNAEEAMNYYVSVFPNSRIVEINYYPDNGEDIDEHLSNMKGKVLTGIFELNGQRFLALDGGNQGFDFNNAISFVLECKDQAELDRYWSKLSAHPDAEQCGWCKDKYNLSWQIIPSNPDSLMTNDAQMKALMQMKKIDIAALKALA